MTAQEKFDIANKFLEEGNKFVYDAIMQTLTDDDLLELLEV